MIYRSNMLIFPSMKVYGPLVERQGTQGHEEATSHQDLEKLDLFSMDWFKGKITGKPHIEWENLWFPVGFPLNQSIDLWLHFRSAAATKRVDITTQSSITTTPKSSQSLNSQTSWRFMGKVSWIFMGNHYMTYGKTVGKPWENTNFVVIYGD